MNRTGPAAASHGAAPAAIDAATLDGWALSHLGRYASSADNLRRVLRRRVRRRLGGDPDRAAAIASADALIEALLVRYRDAALLDDAAYAAARARRDVARGRSLRRIAVGLAEKGIAPEEAAAALAALRDAEADPELAAAAAFARRRRLGPFRAGGDAPDRRRRDLAAFARGGFTRSAAEAVLACPDEGALAELLAGGLR